MHDAPATLRDRCDEKDSGIGSPPSLPEVISVRTPKRVLEAIKLTDVELAEVKAYNMLDLGVSMAAETFDSIIPACGEEGCSDDE